MIHPIAAFRKVVSREATIQDYISHYRNVISSGLKILMAPKRKTNFQKEKWLQDAQTGEFEFHSKDTWRPSEDFHRKTALFFEYFGFSNDQYRNRVIVDLGAGSKLRTKYFKLAKIIAIEPLASRFLKEISWCDLDSAYKVYSKPAEEKIDECRNIADLLVSINVLDHCYHFEQIIENIRVYLKPHALAFLSFDAHRKTDKMHPLILSQEICTDIFVSKGLKVEKTSKGFGEYKGILGRGGDTYGFGESCLNYWLRKE